MKCKDNTILITGGSAGIGLALAKAFVEAQNQVIICGRNEEKLAAVKADFPDIATKRCDLAQKSERSELVTWVLAHYPAINVIINNAGIFEETDLLSDSFDFDLIDKQLTVDLNAPIELALRFLPHLRQQTEAAIINISSALVYSPDAGTPFYGVAKAGIHAFSQTARYQLHDTNVKIVEVLPPRVDTPGLNKALDADQIGDAMTPEETVKEIMKGLSEGKDEIRIGQAKWLYIASRIAPAFVNKKVNEQIKKARKGQ